MKSRCKPRCCFLFLFFLGIYGMPGAAQTIRATHFVLAPSDPNATAVPFESALRIVDIAASAGYNTIVVQIANSVEFDSVPRLTRRGAWSKNELRQFVAHATDRALKVIPEFKFLTHQEKFLQHHYPSLMYNAVTYDPRNKGVYDLVFPLLDEVADLIDPPAIHIGHDEVVGWNEEHAKRHLAEGETMLPAELFAADVEAIYQFLESKAIDTWMWGDMLLAPNEFPSMHTESLHGGMHGYGQVLRSRLPKKIVICDWHYSDRHQEFASLNAFQRDGFRVIATTWKNGETIGNFNRYAAKRNAYGTMATTWYYVPLRRWDVVEQILTNTADAFKYYANGE